MAEEYQDGYVNLDVGGTHFRTSLATLMNGETMLSAMFSGRTPIKPNEKGMIFIDRDGKHFNRILNFLRDGTIALPETNVEIMELKNEAQFYCIDGLVKLCDSENIPSRTREKQEQEDKKLLHSKLERMISEISILNAKTWGVDYSSMYARMSQQNHNFWNTEQAGQAWQQNMQSVWQSARRRLPVLPVSRRNDENHNLDDNGGLQVEIRDAIANLRRAWPEAPAQRFNDEVNLNDENAIRAALYPYDAIVERRIR